MEKKSSNWEFPPDMGCLLMGPLFLAIVCFVVANFVLITTNTLNSANVLKIFYAALAFAGVGAVLHFIARLPLYRRGRFWTVGPRELDRTHRKIYWLAYLFVLAAFGLIAIAWFRTR